MNFNNNLKFGESSKQNLEVGAANKTTLNVTSGTGLHCNEGGNTNTLNATQVRGGFFRLDTVKDPTTRAVRKASSMKPGQT